MKAKLNYKIVTMQQDGWSKVQNDPAIATCVTSQGIHMQLTASTFSNSHLTAWFNLVVSGPSKMNYAVNSQYLLKQSLDCMIQPGTVRST